jgi:hypothetical protein
MQRRVVSLDLAAAAPVVPYLYRGGSSRFLGPLCPIAQAWAEK